METQCIQRPGSSDRAIDEAIGRDHTKSFGGRTATSGNKNSNSTDHSTISGSCTVIPCVDAIDMFLCYLQNVALLDETKNQVHAKTRIDSKTESSRLSAFARDISLLVSNPKKLKIVLV
jgi:hypothetical protein